MRRSTHRRALSFLLGGLAALGIAGAAWAALAPLPALPKERVLVIPKGASPSGLPPFPSDVRLTLGLQDVLVLRNDDDRPQLVGGIEVPAGQSLRIPFHREQELPLACSSIPSGQLTITVVAPPARGPARLWWRLAQLRAGS